MHLENKEPIVMKDATVASAKGRSICKESQTQTPSYGSGGRNPKELGEVYTDLKCQLKAIVNGRKYIQLFVDEASRDKRFIGLKTRDVVTEASAHYMQ